MIGNWKPRAWGLALLLGLALGAPAALAAKSAGNAGVPRGIGPAWPRTAPAMDPFTPFLYARLTTRDRQAFDALVTALAPADSPPEKLAGTFGDLTRLLQLAAFGHYVRLTLDADGNPVAQLDGSRYLEARASDGQSILQILSARAGQAPGSAGVIPGPGNSGPYPIDLVRALARTIAQPETISQGPGTFTCVPAALQRVLAQNRPAEYARLAAALTWDGQVSLQSGRRMTIEPSARTGPGGGQRDICSKVFQESALTLASRALPEVWSKELSDFRARRAANLQSSDLTLTGDEAYGKGRFTPLPIYGGGRFAPIRLYGAGELSLEAPPGAGGEASYDGAAAPGGLTIGQARWLYVQILGDTPQTVLVTPANRESIYAKLIEVLGRKAPIPVITGIQGVDTQGRAAHHVVTLIGYAPTTFQVADPGQDEADNQLPAEGRDVKAALEVIFDF